MLQKDLFQKIDNRESDSCRSDIAPREGADLLAAVGTSVLVVFHIGVSASYHRFQAPAVADRPVISVGEASPVEVASQYIVFQTGYKGNLSDIEMSVVSVYSYEMSFKLTAEPVACFGLDKV